MRKLKVVFKILFLSILEFIFMLAVPSLISLRTSNQYLITLSFIIISIFLIYVTIYISYLLIQELKEEIEKEVK